MPKKSGMSPKKFTNLVAMSESGKKHKKKHKHDSELGPGKKSKEVKKTNNFPL
jgi:hypothetical protein